MQASEQRPLPPLQPCPFCGMNADAEGDDTLYPTGRWREDDGLRHYLLPRDPREEHGRVWTMHCPTTAGGCGAEVSGDSRAEAIAAWNRRAQRDSEAREIIKELMETQTAYARYRSRSLNGIGVFKQSRARYYAAWDRARQYLENKNG